METKGAPESLATVTIKPEYAPSEYSEAPPAYHKHQSSAVQVAKIVAVTVVLVSFVLGSFMLAASYVQANATCRQLENDLELLNEVADRFDPAAQDPPVAEALIGEDPSKHQKRQTGKDTKDVKDIVSNSVDNTEKATDSDDKEVPIHAHFPLTLDFDELAGNLVAKNQKSKMNCIVEKKKAEEVVDHKPKNIMLPFGLNLTTDPRKEKITGERMVIICESGNMISSEPSNDEHDKSQDVDSDEHDDDSEEAIMIQPVMIPIPQTMFQTHMPQQIQPAPQQHQPQFVQPMRPFNPMEQMRPPMPPMQPFRPPMQPFRPPMEIVRPPMESYRPNPAREFVDSYRPMQPQEQMRPPMEQVRPPMEQVRPPMEQMRPQFVAIRQIEMRPMNVESDSQSVESEEPQRPQGLLTVAFRPPMGQPEQRDEPERPTFIPQQVSIRVQSQEPNGEMPPNPIIQHIIQQIITQKIMEARKAQEVNKLPEESREEDYHPHPVPQEPQREIPEGLMHPGLPIPEILTELNRLPNPENRVIVAVATSSDEDSSEADSSESDSASSSASQDAPSASASQSASASSAALAQESAQQDSEPDSQQDNQDSVMQLMQEPRQSAAEMNGRQLYARRLPVSIPVNMHDQEQEPQAVASEEMRPHYVQPRSV